MYMNLFDSHVHSDNSHDGEHSITFLCENAVQKNLMGLCITDHYELDLNTEQADLCLRNSFIETGKARQAFDYRLLVMNGIEMGQATQNLDKAEEVLRKYRFDFLLNCTTQLPHGQKMTSVPSTDRLNTCCRNVYVNARRTANTSDRKLMFHPNLTSETKGIPNTMGISFLVEVTFY